MTKPDLSYLLRKSDPSADPERLARPQQERRDEAARPAGPTAALISRLRNYQVELEAQNKVLR